MRLTVNYTIIDILHNERMITTEREITSDNLQLVRKVIGKLGDGSVFLEDDNGYWLRMYYDTYDDRENKILTVGLCKQVRYTTNVISERKMPRAKVYKLVKKALETGLDEDWWIE